jgi:DNA-binding GntR family transcriptional regulator
MPYEYTPPKYAQVVGELRRRIESGEYPPGSLLPSEHQLSDEFQIARPTVVRALRVLRQDGWIETQQGKGSFVRGRPALAGLETVRPGEEALDRDESGEAGELIEAGPSQPPARVIALLGEAGDGEVLCRRRLVRHEGEPSEIITWWVPAQLAEGTGLATDEPVHGGVRAHLARRKGIRISGGAMALQGPGWWLT